MKEELEPVCAGEDEHYSGRHAHCTCASLSWCSCCGCFGFEYRSLYLNLNEIDFVRLLRIIGSALAEGPRPNPEKLYFRLTDRGFLMVIPHDELEEISSLLLKGYRWMDGRSEPEPALVSSAIH